VQLQKKNLAVKVLWKIIHQIKGFTLLIQIISFNFADINKWTIGSLAENHPNFKNLTFI